MFAKSSAWKSQRITFASFLRRRLTVANPMPFAAPVTNTILFFKTLSKLIAKAIEDYYQKNKK